MENEIEIKEAAKKMVAHLKTKGVPVQHSLMLEAIATGFGLKNWRTLKAVIDAPRQQAPKVPPLGTAQMWTVQAVYRDNDQMYDVAVEARTPLEAAVLATVERLTDCDLEIEVTGVVAAATAALFAPDFLPDWHLARNSTALASLSLCLEKAQRRDPSLFTPEIEVFRRWLEAILEEAATFGDELSELSWSAGAARLQGLPEGTISEDRIETPAYALTRLVAVVLDAHGGAEAFEKANLVGTARDIYHVQALTESFPLCVNHYLAYDGI